jgi:hypothetical protein
VADALAAADVLYVAVAVADALVVVAAAEDAVAAADVVGDINLIAKNEFFY